MCVTATMAGYIRIAACTKGCEISRCGGTGYYARLHYTVWIQKLLKDYSVHYRK